MLKYIDINEASFSGLTPLHLASKLKLPAYDIVKVILENGADANGLDWMNYSPLHHMAYAGNTSDHVKTLIELLNHGANVNATPLHQFRLTPLHTAVSYGNDKIVKVLLDHGANIDAVNIDRDTPLHYACTSGHVSIVKILLLKGCKVDVMNDSKYTPLNTTSSLQR